MSKRLVRDARRGEGTIVQLGPTRFRAQVSCGIDPKTGRRARWSAYAKTWDEAHRLRAAFLAQGAALASLDGSQTLAEYLPRWADTVRDNERTHHFHLDKIAPTVRHLGHVKLAALSRKQVYELLNVTLKNEPRPSGATPLAPRTRGHVRNVLRAALEHAINEEGILRENVAKRLKIIGLRDDFDPYVLSHSERAAFLRAAEEADKERVTKARFHRERATKARFTGQQAITMRAFWTFSIEHGPRSGEGLGLQWRHVDLDEGTVRIEQQLQRIRGGGSTKGKPKGAGERLELVPLKTRMGKRVITLDPASLEALRAQRAHHLELRRALGDDWNPLDLVFPTINGYRMQGSLLSQLFKDICGRAGITPSTRSQRGFRIHDCRHTAATYMLVELKSIRDVQVALGHSTTKMTERYLHLIPTGQRRQIA